MQVRSWMAALLVLAGTTGSQMVEVRAQGSAPVQKPQKDSNQARSRQSAQNSDETPEKPGAYAVRMRLTVAGLGRNGCDVDVNPGNRSCRFRTQTVHVNSDGVVKLLFRDVELRGADRNCMFSITLREPGQDSRTVYRGFRIASKSNDPPSKQPVQSFTCFVNSPSKLAGMDLPGQTRQ